MGEVLLGESVPSFSKFQVSVPHVLLEALLQLQEPDSMVANAVTSTGVNTKLTVKRTATDNIQIQADGGEEAVLEGADNQWCFTIQDVTGPIYLVTGGGGQVNETIDEQRPDSSTEVEYEEGHVEEPFDDSEQLAEVDDGLAVSDDVSEHVLVETVEETRELDVENAYPGIIRTLEHSHQERLEEEYDEDATQPSVTSKPMRSDVDLLLAAIEASNAAEKATASTPSSPSGSKRGPGRPRKPIVQMPGGEQREDILAVMQDIPLITKDVITYKCYRCSKSFTSMDTLKRHMKTKHDERIEVDSVATSLLPNAYICFACQRPTAGLRSLQKHLLGVHKLKYSKDKAPSKPRYVAKNTRRDPKNPDVPSVQCEVCGKQVISYDNLRNHTKKVHGDHPQLEELLKRILDTRLKHHKRKSVVTIICPICGDRFCGMPAMKHIKMVHGPNMSKEDLDTLLVQVKKEIQKSYNLLKKEKAKKNKCFTCPKCLCEIPIVEKNYHMKECTATAVIIEARDGIVDSSNVEYTIAVDTFDESANLNLNLPDEQDTPTTGNHEVGEISIDNQTSDEIYFQVVEGDGTQVVQASESGEKATKMVSLLKQKIVYGTAASAGAEVAEQSVSAPISIIQETRSGAVKLKSPTFSKIQNCSSPLKKTTEGQPQEDETLLQKRSGGHFEAAAKKLKLFSCKSHKCRECNKVFATEEALGTHKKSSHQAPSFSLIGEEQRVIKHYVCGVCRGIFNSEVLLDEHMLTHPVKNALTCVSCPKTFNDHEKLVNHVRMVHEKKFAYHCEDCNQGWNKDVHFKFHKCPGKSDKATVNDQAENGSEPDSTKNFESEPGELDFKTIMEMSAMSDSDEEMAPPAKRSKTTKPPKQPPVQPKTRSTGRRGKPVESAVETIEVKGKNLEKKWSSPRPDNPAPTGGVTTRLSKVESADAGRRKSERVRKPKAMDNK